MIPNTRLDELAAMEQAATAGPWKVCGPFPDVTVGIDDSLDDDPSVGHYGFEPLLKLYQTAESYGDVRMVPDAAFIAASRNEFAAMIEQCKEANRLREEIDRLKVENEKLAAELAAKEIRWTDAKPTTPGWWWRRVGEGHEASCAFVGTGWEPGELLVQLYRHNGLWKIESLCGQWSDKPIPQPEERT